MKHEAIVRQAWQDIEPMLAAHSYELVEVEYAGGPGGAMVLRVFVDKSPGGVTLDDCTAVAQLLGPSLDENDFIGEHYNLEVSSPGIDRPVRKPADFRRFVGESVRLIAYSPIQGRKKFAGVLIGFEDDLIGVECDGVSYHIHVENLKRANLDR